MKKQLQRISLIAMFALFGLSNIANAQWVTTAYTDGNISCLTSHNNDVYVGNKYFGVYKLSSDGTVSTAMNTGLPGVPFINDILSEGGVLYAGATNAVYKSVDDGANWALSGMTTTTYALTSNTSGIYALIASGSYQTVSRSTDNGTNWTGINVGLPTNAYGYDLTSNGSTLLVTYESGIYRSTDNGDNWTLVKAITTPNLYLGVNGNVFYAGSTNGNWYKSIDDGITWTDHTSAIGANIYSFAFAENVIFVGTENSVWSSSDAGVTFTSADQNTPISDVDGLAISGNYIYMGTGSGFAVYKRPLSEFGVTTGISVSEKGDSELISVYPNPSDGIFQITSNKLQFENLEIYNAIGEKIYTSKTSISNSIIDISNQPKGIYLVKMYEGNTAITKRIVIQ